MNDDGPDCPHGYPAWRKTKTGEPLCPMCRRVTKAQTKATAPRTTHRQPVLDVAMLRAGEDPDDAQVIPITTARRRKAAR
jgi:uncharacterized Zn finger protein (UPF0148 family)